MARIKKAPHRYVPRTVAPPETCRIQFRRLVREIARSLDAGLMIRAEAFLILQEASEAHVVRLFEEANQCASFSRRDAITPRDVRLACRIRG